jgi:uncharacterized protein YndB with AHSA1/START domain
MPDILHKIDVRSSPAATYAALTTLDGLSGWWTTTTQGNSEVGGTIAFRFGSLGRFDMKVLELLPARRVLWQVVDGPEEWIGTKVSFELRPDGDFTAVVFKHQGWKAPVEFMHHCSTKWATYLLSMKSLLEGGKGRPHPEDVHISARGD